MASPSTPKNILAIESAIADGSIAVIREGHPMLEHVANGASRAERILSIVEGLLGEAGISPGDLDVVAVSTGPGSYSGIRIGMSIALGLRDALGLKCVGVPVLSAMSHVAQADEPLICAVPVGKGDIAWQSFESRGEDGRRKQSDARLGSVPSFASALEAAVGSTLFAHEEVLVRVKDRMPDDLRLLDAGRGLAKFVGRFALQGTNGDDSMHPIYLRNQEVANRSF